MINHLFLRSINFNLIIYSNKIKKIRILNVEFLHIYLILFVFETVIFNVFRFEQLTRVYNEALNNTIEITAIAFIAQLNRRRLRAARFLIP